MAGAEIWSSARNDQQNRQRTCVAACEHVNKPLVWNVYTNDWNGKRIETDNIFDHGYFLDDCRKAARKYRDDREKFCEVVRRSLSYWFRSKCEWEVVISSWPPRTDPVETKVDVYDQVVLNWDVFCDYIWSHAVDLRRRERRK